ncbi:MAG TPA: trehalose-6-phosphate synthase [Steroidobacteraceae bacterium]|nr:trehalose-6-phosphate synthase [Steroidobacteraceae bacterium]
MSRLVAVSNRISLPRRGAAPGGLAVGLAAAMRARGGLWFGWSGEVVESPAQLPETARRDGIGYATIDLSRAEHDEHYLGFCNGVLWPVFHYFPDNYRHREQDYERYLAVNQRFASALQPLLRPDDVIWVHDFHLLPLAQRLRAGGVTQPIGLFLHIPFPHVELLRVLPVYGELLGAMLDYDLVGFQTMSDLEAFRAAVVHLWGPEALVSEDEIQVGTRRLRAAVFPIGVDVDAIQAEVKRARPAETCRRMVAGMLGRKLVIGVDRLDYSKGLVERFGAYERFLETHPENQGRVTFLQIAPLSRPDLHAYASIRSELEQATGRTNGRFADTDWTPIRYLNRNFPHDVLMAFMNCAQVGIVTPLRDGMNLVAKEFVAAQDPDDPGVLVLSTLAGASRELTGALQVNPYDRRGMAHAIQQALNMPLDERRARHAGMLQTLRRSDIHAWYSRYLAALAATRDANLPAALSA